MREQEEAVMGYTLKELRELTDEQLIAEHDNVAQSTARLGVNYYLDELKRREQNKQTEAMLAYTRRMLWLTVFVAICTVALNAAILQEVDLYRFDRGPCLLSLSWFTWHCSPPRILLPPRAFRDPSSPAKCRPCAGAIRPVVRRGRQDYTG
jgi:hypothetical protein